MRAARFAPFEPLLLLGALGGCQHPDSHAKRPSVASSSAASVASNALARGAGPRAASRFACQNGKCRQAQPRLPDTGEWRCADLGHVVWCAGGEPAAGVVSGPPDARFRCGPRWGANQAERVCIDRHPDYPDNQRDTFKCSFEQERGVARVCQSGEAWPGAELAASAVPACWLDRDCASGGCDRGACRCAAAGDCQTGRCVSGVCVEATP